MKMKTRVKYGHSFRVGGLTVVLMTFAAVQGRTQEVNETEGDWMREVAAHPEAAKGTATLPIVFCWYKGKPALYIRTDASDPGAAAQQGVNLVPQLSNAIDAPNGAVDDIYQVTNFNQGNVIPSAPIPAGPMNADPSYSPLWQVTLVTWAKNATPHVLTSEEAIKAARDAGQVTLEKTRIVVNCPVIYTPFGGKLPTVKIHIDRRDGEEHND